MKAVVLVGGEGTRLRPLTYTTPKQLLPVAETPMLERVLGVLRGLDVDEVVLSLGYKPDAFVEAYPDGVAAGLRLVYAVEPTPLDTAGAIRFAAESAGVDETFLVLNGDVLTDADLGALLRLHRARRAAATILLTPVDDPSRFGVVVTDDDGRVGAFVEKPAPGTEPSNRINAGTYVMEPDVLAAIAAEGPVSVERVTFPALAAAGTLYAFCDTAYWLDTGTPESFLQANLDLVSGRRAGASADVPPLPGARRLDGGPWATGRVTLDGRADGASLLGEGVVVEGGASVEASVIGAGAVVGAGTVVLRSVLLPGTRLGAGSRVVDSVIGKRVEVGPGSSLGGLSLIGDDVVLASGTVLQAARVRAGDAGDAGHGPAAGDDDREEST